MWNYDVKMRKTYFDFERCKLRETFLYQCRKRNLVPKGLQLRINLALKPTCPDLLDIIHRALVTENTTIMENVYVDTVLALDQYAAHLDSLKKEDILQYGQDTVNRSIHQARANCKRDLNEISNRHSRKLCALAQYSTSERPYDVQRAHYGSVRVVAIPLYRDPPPQHGRATLVPTKPHPDVGLAVDNQVPPSRPELMEPLMTSPAVDIRQQLTTYPTYSSPVPSSMSHAQTRPITIPTSASRLSGSPITPPSPQGSTTSQPFRSTSWNRPTQSPLVSPPPVPATGYTRMRKTHRGGRSTRKITLRNTRRIRKRRGRCGYIPTQEELSHFDPIVLASNVQLTSEQIEICRMSDRFAPTPKEPIDVSDQLIGTHAWAERLRWYRFHEMRKKQLSRDELSDGITDESSDESEYVKRPWHKPTSRPAPTGDPALESFIATCQRDFMNIESRKKIKDNLNPGQRKALAELKNLPLTHGAACRYADKSGATVITSLEEDDRIVKEAILDPSHYDQMTEDPTKSVIKKVCDWAKKWKQQGVIDDDVAEYVTYIRDSHLAKCKPLVKTHKAKPFPYRLLLSGSGTPVQPLSKFVHQAISHLTAFLPYQVIDTKEFLQKLETINNTMTPLPPEACLAICDVVALYPSVDNSMGVPAVKNQLAQRPSPLNVPKNCVVEALEIALENNSCAYMDGEGETTIAAPNSGTAMGPCHACEYVDVFMNEIDNKLVDTSPVPLLSSLSPGSETEVTNQLNWSRFRDDGFAVLPDVAQAQVFADFLQTLHPSLKWTVEWGRQKNYLDLTVSITEEGKITTDVFFKKLQCLFATKLMPRPLCLQRTGSRHWYSPQNAR